MFFSLVPRSRNSIAVSSVEHLKNGNKRPHSIISVSSSSSSNSSHSSGFGAMTIPGLEPMPEDSIMPGARTSLTLCSNGKNTALLLYSKCASMKHELNTTRDMASKYIGKFRCSWKQFEFGILHVDFYITLVSTESGISLGSNSSSPCMVDGYTQTTLKKGVHRSDSGVSSDYSLSLTSGTSPETNLMSTDVSRRNSKAKIKSL